MLSKEHMVVSGSILLSVVSVSGVLIAMAIPREMAYILMPTLVTIIVFVVFVAILKHKIGDNLFGELGFIYLSLAVAYTVFPAFTFLAVDLNFASGWVWEKLALLLPAPYELGLHLWRHVLFVVGVAVGYLLVRGHKVPRLDPIKSTGSDELKIIVFLTCLIAVCILSISLLSAPVATYIDNYTRFEHLSWLSLRFAYVCMSLKVGSYFILMTILFKHYKRFKYFIFFLILVLGIYEMVYSFGSRIETLTLLLGFACLYHYAVRPITLKMGLMSFLAIAVLFSMVELFRSSGFDSSLAKDALSRDGGMPASEFGAVYFTGFHLYAERAQGAIPHRQCLMFFSDFISLVPFADHIRWNPQYWYAAHYFPDAIVPPQTMGPIAESAIWGGEMDLLFRSIINGAVFAYVVRWFLFRKDKWWAIVVYVYCYATCVMTLKYSIFYQLTPLFRILIPSLLVIAVAKQMIARIGKPVPRQVV